MGILTRRIAGLALVLSGLLLMGCSPITDDPPPPASYQYAAQVLLAAPVAGGGTRLVLAGIGDPPAARALDPALLPLTCRIRWAETSKAWSGLGYRDDRHLGEAEVTTIAPTRTGDGGRAFLITLPTVATDGSRTVVIQLDAPGPLTIAGTLGTRDAAGAWVHVPRPAVFVAGSAPDIEQAGTTVSSGSGAPPSTVVDPLLREALVLNELDTRFRRVTGRWDRINRRMAGPGVRVRPTLVDFPADEVMASAENRLLFSDDLTAPGWGKVLVQVVGDAGIAPDGTATAELVQPTSESGLHYVKRGFVAVDAEEATVAVYAKAQGWPSLYLEISARDGDYPAVLVDLVAGTVTRASQRLRDVAVESAGEGWWRIQASLALGSGTAATAVAFHVDEGRSTSGDGVAGVLVWGAQSVAGRHAAPRIPTGAEPVRVDQDVLEVDIRSLGADFSGAGTLAILGRPRSRGDADPVAHPLLAGVTSEVPATADAPLLIDPCGGRFRCGGTWTTARKERLMTPVLWAVSWNAGAWTVSENGVAIHQGTGASGTLRTVRLGGADQRCYNGDVLGLWWPRALADEALRQVAEQLVGHRGLSEVACWGDSLTDGVEGAMPWPEVLTREIDPWRWLDNRAVGGSNSIDCRQLLLATTERHDWVNVLWTGRNNSFDEPQVMADLRSMVDALPPPKRFLVLSILTSRLELRGTTTYQHITSLNSWMETTWPERYLDVRRLLIDAYDPASPTDVLQHDGDTVPESLRIDGLHLNTVGNRLVARAVAGRLAELGW